jgi:hypothetical protein
MSRFTLKQYEKNENINYHTENSLELIKQYGTKEEIKEMQEIYDNHMKQSHITYKDIMRRYELSNKYYQNLVKESENIK